MYKCCECKNKIAWFVAIGASPWLPVTCGVCKTEQHHPWASFTYSLFGIALAIPALIGLFFVIALFGETGEIVAIAVLFGTYILIEIVAFKRGILLRTEHKQKIRSRVLWLLLLIILLALLLFV